MILQTWGDTLVGRFQDVGAGVVGFIPNLLVAIIIFLAGWVVGSLVGNVVARIVKSLRVDNALESAGIGTLLHRAGLKLDAGKFLGMLIEWFVVIVFLIASFDVLGLHYVNEFLVQVVAGYLPEVIVAVLVLLVGGVVAEAMQKVVAGSAKAAALSSANFLGSVTKWSIWTFAIVIALSHLGIGVVYLQTLFTGIVVALSIAAGLAFGLGGQDAAAQVIDKVRRDIAEHRHQG
jgi:small-conductance mechanosensitive channel